LKGAVVASACLGAAERCLEMSAGYVKQRTAFGRPIGKFEGTSFQMAEDYTRLEMLKLLLQKGCWMIDKYYSEPGSITRKDINVVIAQCKWMASLLDSTLHKIAACYLMVKSTPRSSLYQGLVVR